MACRKDGKGRVLRKGEGYRKGDGAFLRDFKGFYESGINSRNRDALGNGQEWRLRWTSSVS